MVGIKRWNKAVTRLVAVCALFLLVLSPNLDAAVCQEDLTSPVATQSVQLVIGAARQPGAPATGMAKGICLCGHCHFGAPFLSPALDQPDAPAGALGEQHARLEALEPAAGPLFELNRPPRA